MAKVSWPDRKRIKRTIIDAYTPGMRDRFPSTTPEIASHCHAVPTCPIGVDITLLKIQVTLLRVRDRYCVTEFFIPLHEGRITMAELCKRQRTDRRYIYRRIDQMLDEAIIGCPRWKFYGMKQGTAEMILSVYWEMHKEDDYQISGGNNG